MLGTSLRMKKKCEYPPPPTPTLGPVHLWCLMISAFVTHMQLRILYNALPGRKRIEGRFSRGRAHIKLSSI